MMIVKIRSMGCNMRDTSAREGYPAVVMGAWCTSKNKNQVTFESIGLRRTADGSTRRNSTVLVMLLLINPMWTTAPNSFPQHDRSVHIVTRTHQGPLCRPRCRRTSTSHAQSHQNRRLPDVAADFFLFTQGSQLRIHASLTSQVRPLCPYTRLPILNTTASLI